MNAIGIDVSKGKSKVAIIRHFGEVARKPFDIMHYPDQLAELAEYIHSLEGESRVVMEHTGKYSEPIANFLCDTDSGKDRRPHLLIRLIRHLYQLGSGFFVVPK